MKLLLTNDDGFNARGIRRLYEVLSKKHEVWIMAPAENRSGSSSSISMLKKMEIQKHGENLYRLGGTPVDCVIAAMRGDFFAGRPDAVISGINEGANLGTDIVYSGTCGAARQASLYGVPGIALSVCEKDGKKPECFDAMADFALENIQYLMSLCGTLSEKKNEEGLDFFVNVNGLPLKKYDGMSFSSPCRREYHDTATVSKEGEKTFLVIGGCEAIESFGGEDSDYSAVEKNLASVTVLSTMPFSCSSPSSDLNGGNNV